jgi:hypothetical protein
MKQILAAIMTFLVVVPVTAFAQPDWMVKARETEDMIFGRINVDCSHVYNSDVNICFLQTAFSNATSLSIEYMKEWIIEKYYNMSQSDARFSPILWAYNQTTPAINYVTNWVNLNFFNKTESDARYLQFTENNNTAANIKIVYTVGNYTSESTTVMTPITNLTWNTSSYKRIGFDCYITYMSNATANGLGLMIETVPNPTYITAVTSFMKGAAVGGSDIIYDVFVLSNNQTAEASSSNTENAYLLVTTHGNIEVDSNSEIRLYFRAEMPNKKSMIINGSNCRWWGFG